MKQWIVPAQIVGSAALCVQIFAAPVHTIHVNQVGYERTLPKSAVLDIPVKESVPSQFTLVDKSTGSVVFTGTVAASAWDTLGWYTNRKFARIDFSSVETAGNYEIQINSNGTWTSYPFEIDDDLLLKKTFPMVVSYFNASRNSGEVWTQDQSVPVYDGTDYPQEFVDVSGGWYDASGDISKYLSHLQYANFMSPQQTPFVVWQMAHILDNYSAVTDRINQTSALQSEAAWGADFLVRMKSTNPYFYATVFDGWSGDLTLRTVCAYSGLEGIQNTDYQAAFREGGGVAIASLAACSRLGISGAFSASDYLAAAVSAYDHLKTSNLSYCDNGSENIIDDYCALMAATELYKATGTALYLTDARERAASILNRQHNEGWFYADNGSRPYYHAVEYGLPAIALTLYAEMDSLTDQSSTTTGSKNYLTHTKTITDTANPFGMARELFTFNGTNRARFFMPQTNETGYWWQGEDARLASVAAMAVIGKKHTAVPAQMTALALDQLDWILGKNPFGYCMMKGAGSNNPPSYGFEKYGHTDLDGGISNGIHSGADGGDGIDFIVGTAPDFLEETWRSSEQWIPHAAWYMLAVAALSGESKDDIVSLKPESITKRIGINLTGTANVVLYDIAGRVIHQFEPGSMAMINRAISEYPLAKGVYIIKISGGSSELIRKIVRQ